MHPHKSRDLCFTDRQLVFWFGGLGLENLIPQSMLWDDLSVHCSSLSPLQVGLSHLTDSEQPHSKTPLQGVFVSRCRVEHSSEVPACGGEELQLLCVTPGSPSSPQRAKSAPSMKLCVVPEPLRS